MTSTASLNSPSAHAVAHFCDPDTHESTKGAVHGAVLTLALLCLVYNACAWHQRKVPRLAMNAVLYAGLGLFELGQVLRHCR